MPVLEDGPSGLRGNPVIGVPSTVLTYITISGAVRLRGRAPGAACCYRLKDPVTRRHKVTPHALRHTYATRMLRQGFDVSEVQALLGHANLGTTSVYLHADPVRLRESVQGRKPADPQVAKLAVALAAMPAEARAALLEALQECG